MSAAAEASERELGPGDWAIIALLAEQPVHGWGLIQKLKPDGEIGAVWSMPRPSVYRALEQLQQRGLIEPDGLERGERGPYRMVFKATRKGRAALKAWLAEPVEHVREIRWLFLLKLVLAARAGIDREPMIRAQRDGARALAPPTLEEKLGQGTRRRRTSLPPLPARHARARVVHFLDDLLAGASASARRCPHGGENLAADLVFTGHHVALERS